MRLTRAGAPRTDPAKREMELDFIRGIAILLVLVFHYRDHTTLITWRWLAYPQNFGWVGVDVFFVLSGFLVGGLLLKEWKTTGSVDSVRFLKRRGFKIWPAYYFFLLIAVLVHVRAYREFLWQNLCNVQNYFFSSLAHTWSLAVEEHFYLALAAVMALFSARRWKPATLLTGCIVVILGVVALRAWMIATHRSFFYQTHTRIDALLMGVVLACLRHFYPKAFAFLQRQRVILLLVLALGIVALYRDKDAAVYLPNMTSRFLIMQIDLASAALLLLLYRPGGVHRWPYRAVAWIGVFSYGIYLWHASVLRPVDWLLPHVPRPMAALTSTVLPFVLAILIGVAASKAIELPFLRLRERVVPPRTPEPPPPPADEFAAIAIAPIA